MARLLADESFPLPVTVELRRLGQDVVTVQEMGEADQGLGDAEVLALAKEQERAVLTLNRRDFVRLHQDSSDHAGIIVCSFDIDFTGQAGRIVAALETTDSISGALLRVNRPGWS